MAVHKVRVTQVCRVERTILVDVQADSLDQAIAIQEESDAPSLTSGGWEVTSDSLESEEVQPA